jgi:hypothetical protein
MGGEQDGLTQGPQVVDHRPRLTPSRRVEPGGRLVEEQHVRVADETEGELQPPALAAAEGPDPRRGLFGQADDLEQLSGVPPFRVHTAVDVEGLANLEFLLYRGLLQDDADALLQVALGIGRIVTQHAHVARGAIAVTLEDLHDGGLPRAVGTE